MATKSIQCIIRNTEGDVIDVLDIPKATAFDDIVNTISCRYEGSTKDWSFKVDFDDFNIDGSNPKAIRRINAELEDGDFATAVFDITLQNNDDSMDCSSTRSDTEPELDELDEESGNANECVEYGPFYPITPDMYHDDYTDPIVIGHYLPCDVERTEVDNLPIDLSFFPNKSRKVALAHTIALIYADIHYYCNTKLARHILSHKFRGGRPSFLKNFDVIIKLLSSDCQTGKTGVCIELGVFSLFVGKTPFIFLRNIGGDISKLSFKRSLKQYLDIFVESTGHFGVDASFASVLKEIFIADMTTLKGFNKKKPEHELFLICENSNSTKYRDVFNARYGTFEIVWETKRFVFIKDEADEDFCSQDGTVGTSERSQLFDPISAFGVSPVKASFMTFFITATPINIDLASSKCGFKIDSDVIRARSNYKGFTNSRINVHIVDARARTQRPKFTRSGDITVAQPVEQDVNQAVDFPKTFKEERQGILSMMACAVLYYAFHDINVLITTPNLSKNSDKEEYVDFFIPELVEQHPTIPMVGFHSDGATVTTFVWNSELFGIINFAALKKKLLKKYKTITDSDLILDLFEVDDGKLRVSFNKKTPKTTNLLYDIAHLLYKYSKKLNKWTKHFVVCVAYKHAGRSVPFKTTDHKYPLTHMYASEAASKDANHSVNIVQQASRVASCDDYDYIPRHFFCSQEYYNSLQLALQYSQERNALLGNRTTHWDEFKEQINPEDHPAMWKLLNIAGTRTKCAATKKRIQRPATEELQELLKNKRARLEESADEQVTKYLEALVFDIRQAYENTRVMSNVYSKIEYWETMSLEAERVMGQHQSLSDQRRTWVTLCLLFAHLVLKYQFTMKEYNSLKVEYGDTIVTLTNLTKFKPSTGRGGGHSWRPWSGTKHLEKQGSVYRLCGVNEQ